MTVAEEQQRQPIHPFYPLDSLTFGINKNCQTNNNNNECHTKEKENNNNNKNFDTKVLVEGERDSIESSNRKSKIPKLH